MRVQSKSMMLRRGETMHVDDNGTLAHAEGSKLIRRVHPAQVVTALIIFSIPVISLNMATLRPKAMAALRRNAWGLPNSQQDLTGSEALFMSRSTDDNFFDMDSAPASLVSSLRSIVGGPQCEADPHALITACCDRRACGGFADRLRGLATLLVVAKLTKRRLCFARDYFVAAPNYICNESEGVHSIVTSKDVKILRAVSTGVTLENPREVQRYKDLHKGIRFVETSFQLQGVEELASSEILLGPQFHHRIGMLALAISRVVNAEMVAAQNAIESILMLHRRSTKVVTLHTRCGGSAFTVGQGVTIDKTTGADNNFQFALPQNLLVAARALPGNLVCQHGLYIASDSTHFRAEMQIALPRGVSVISCCSASHHIDHWKPSTSAVIQQHLVDIQAFARSEKIFATGGGFATSGRNGREWAPVPLVRLQGSTNNASTSADAHEFMQKIVTAMNCTSHTRRGK